MDQPKRERPVKAQNSLLGPGVVRVGQSKILRMKLGLLQDGEAYQRDITTEVQHIVFGVKRIEQKPSSAAT